MKSNNAINLQNATPWTNIIIGGFLSFLVFISALAVVYNKHLSRQLFAQLQNLQQEVEELQVEWTQLLLEQGTWGNEARLERVARERLQMVLPEPHEVVVIKE